MVSDLVQNIAITLSTITILLCLFLKIPQILSILRLKHADGINLSALLLEITGFSVMTLYNYMQEYSLLTYLEYPIILCQLYIMLYFVLKYKCLIDHCLVPVGVITYIFTMILFLLQAISKNVLSCIVPLCTPLSAMAKISYICGIIQAGNSDAISMTTWSISIFTNLVRIFTVYVDSADVKLLCNFIISTILSTGVLVTALMHSCNNTGSLVTYFKQILHGCKNDVCTEPHHTTTTNKRKRKQR